MTYRTKVRQRPPTFHTASRGKLRHLMSNFDPGPPPPNVPPPPAAVLNPIPPPIPPEPQPLPPEDVVPAPPFGGEVVPAPELP